MKILLSILRSYWLWSILGLGAVASLIWIVGPLLSIGAWEPFASTAGRLVGIGIVTLLWALHRAWRWWRAKRTNAAIMDGLTSRAPEAASGPAPGEAESAEELATIRSRFEEAMAVLKQAGKKRRFGSAYLYDLPWYIIIGPPGSGKTTALLNSGLNFPLAERFGKDAIRGVGGTRNCDWWFTDEAVLLDTAGRYTTQDSFEAVDKSAWLGFLKLLKKTRKRRPINGALVAVSVSDLLQLSESERSAHARAIKQRIQELHGEFGIRFPIYLLFTKCDLVAGFMEFYGDLGREEREQVWGMTFPLDEKETEAGVLRQFGAEFEALEKRLNDRLVQRLQEERDPQRRNLIYTFPQQFGSLKGLLEPFLQEIFQPSRFETVPQLRGVYFTSGTQEGSPIDRVMGAMAATFQVDRQALPAFVGHGQSYFITRLFKNVVFPEAGLAGTNLRLERQRRWLTSGAYLTATAVTLLAAAAWTTSYSRNSAYVTDVQSEVNAIQAEIDAMNPEQRDLLSVLPLLNRLRDLPGGYADRESGTPWTMGLGLYQGDKLGAEARAVYQRVLRRAFLPRVVLRLEEQLRGAMGEPDYLYEALKVYLMLDNPEHFDAATVQTWMALDWEHNLPRDVTKEQRQQLEEHLQAALSKEAGVAPIPLDGKLVARARDVLLRVPLAQRIYARIKQERLGGDIPEFRISDAAGPDAPLVFVRKSGLPLNKGISGLYTYAGYHDVFAEQAPKLVNDLAGESWILGDKAPAADPAKMKALVGEVRDLYFKDYIRQWDDLLADLDIAPFTSLQQGVEILRVLSGPDSPLRRLLTAVAAETNLDPREEDAATGLVERAGEQADALRSRLGRFFGERPGQTVTTAPATLPEHVVTEHFANLQRVAEAQGDGPPALDGVISSLNELYIYVNAIASAADRGDAALQAARGQAGMGGDVVGKVRQEADRLPLPLQGWVKGVAADSAGMTLGGVHAHLNNIWTSNVLPFFRQALSGRYPLVRSSTREATLEDFGRFFGPNGLMDDFFNKYLAELVDTSGRTWRWRAAGGARIGISNSVLREFQKAAAIRDAFFPAGGAVPSVNFTLVPQSLDAKTRSFLLDLEGQLAEYRHGPTRQVRLQWPAPNGTGQVRLVFEDAQGNRPGVTERGPWAWFRVLDKARIEPTNVADRFKVTFSLGSQSASYELQASSVRNPFKLDALTTFRCPERL